MRDQMRGLEDLRPDENLWADVRDRTPGPVPPRPSNGHRFVAVVTALAISIASVWFLAWTFGRDQRAGVPTGPAPAPAPSFDGWQVAVSLAPTRIGPLRFSVGPITASKKKGAGWVQHAATVQNVGQRAVRLGDARVSTFVGSPPKSLLVADWGCGYASSGPGKPIHPNACESYLDEHLLKPGQKITRTIWLAKGLPGMTKLESGTFNFEQPVTYVPLGQKGAELRQGHVGITYTIDQVPPLSFTAADGWYNQAYIHQPGTSDPSQAWTSNEPFASGVQPPAFPDPSTLADGQVLVLAWEVAQGPPDPTNPNFPIIQGPMQLTDPTTGYEGTAPGTSRSIVLAQIDGRYIQVEVDFASDSPSSDMKAAAQSALDRLVVAQSLRATFSGAGAADELTATCTSGGVRLASNVIAPHPDGVRIDMSNPGGAAFVEFHPKNAPAGEAFGVGASGRGTSPLSPGIWEIACLQRSSQSYKDVPTTRFEVVDPNSYWVTPGLDCQSPTSQTVKAVSEQTSTNATPGELRTAASNQLTGVQSTDVFQGAGYGGRIFKQYRYWGILIREGQRIASVKLNYDGTWTVESCVPDVTAAAG
jgi:hypothetical protein